MIPTLEKPDRRVHVATLLKVLENWEGKNIHEFGLVKRSLYVAKDTPKATEVVTKIIRNYQNDRRNGKHVSIHFEQYRVILMLPLKHIWIWQKETAYILKNWRRHNRQLVGACLIGNKENLDLVKAPCSGILFNWEKEISYQKGNYSGASRRTNCSMSCP